jgi:hypothetical protein
MKKILFLGLLALTFSAARAQKAAAPQVSEAVLKTAGLVKFPYKETLAKARKGDLMATREFMEFHRVVDGVEAIQHGLTCLELIPHAGDDIVAQALTTARPRMRQVILERLQLAQVRTRQEALKRPMSEWAPQTQTVLSPTPSPDTNSNYSPGDKKRPAKTSSEGKPSAAGGH